MTTIATRYLKAALMCAAKKDIRYYLNGVCLQFEQGLLRILGTDGHVMLVGWQALDYDGPPREVIIPADSVKAALSAAGKAETIELEGDMLGNTRFTAIDGVLPDWRRIVPAPEAWTDERADFNPDLLQQVHSALRTWAGAGKYDVYKLHTSGPKGVGKYETIDCAVYVMPLIPGKAL